VPKSCKSDPDIVPISVPISRRCRDDIVTDIDADIALIVPISCRYQADIVPISSRYRADIKPILDCRMLGAYRCRYRADIRDARSCRYRAEISISAPISRDLAPIWRRYCSDIVPILMPISCRSRADIAPISAPISVPYSPRCWCRYRADLGADIVRICSRYSCRYRRRLAPHMARIDATSSTISCRQSSRYRAVIRADIVPIYS